MICPVCGSTSVARVANEHVCNMCAAQAPKAHGVGKVRKLPVVRGKGIVVRKP